MHKTLTDSVPIEEPDGSPAGLSSDQQDALRALGYMYLQTGQKYKALTLFEALHHLLPDDHSIALSLIYSRQVLGHYQAALDLAESLLAETIEDSHIAPLHLLCAHALQGQGRSTEARLQLLSHQAAKGNPP
ncbi:MAG: hypothetical protein V2J55_17610 [Candidatus Competibacteraceae bacterium]|nr:hypothetical protein [Candidatus Competibacteraceae bacterium]